MLGIWILIQMENLINPRNLFRLRFIMSSEIIFVNQVFFKMLATLFVFIM